MTSIQVIAEAGVNHDGCLEKAISLVEIAALAGADYVKFQLFDLNEQISVGAPTAEYQNRSGTTHADMLKLAESYQLPWHSHLQIFEQCRTSGIKYCASVFCRESLEFYVDNFSPEFIKIASGELTNKILLEAAGRAGLPIILSTGMATPGELDDALHCLLRKSTNTNHQEKNTT